MNYTIVNKAIIKLPNENSSVDHDQVRGIFTVEKSAIAICFLCPNWAILISTSVVDEFCAAIIGFNVTAHHTVLGHFRQKNCQRDGSQILFFHLKAWSLGVLIHLLA